MANACWSGPNFCFVGARHEMDPVILYSMRFWCSSWNFQKNDDLALAHHELPLEMMWSSDSWIAVQLAGLVPVHTLLLKFMICQDTSSALDVFSKTRPLSTMSTASTSGHADLQKEEFTWRSVSTMTMFGAHCGRSVGVGADCISLSMWS